MTLEPEILFLLKIVLVIAGIVLCAFFAGSETALVSLSSMTIAELKKRKPFREYFFAFWESHPDRVLIAMVLGNTFATVFCGVMAASIGKDLAKFSALSSHTLIPLLSLVVGFAVLVFGEILPKITGRVRSEKIASFVIVPLVPITKMIHPLVWFFLQFAAVLVKVLGRESSKETPNLTVMELDKMLDSESSAPHKILKNIMEFRETEVKELQRPIQNVFAVDVRHPSREIIRTVAGSPYSRILAIQGSFDNILGIIYAKDLLTAWRAEGLILIYDLLRPVFFVSEEMLVSDLLREFKKGRHHLAVVKNKEGKPTGIVTLADVLEEIVGEVYDETKFN